MNYLCVSDFLDMAASRPVFDVRSPKEFEHARIPGALSLPLFDNEERAVVGTLYTHQGKVQAVQKGLDFVGPKLRGFTKFALKQQSPEVLVHCWRGGMRSSSMAWLLETVGLKAFVLEGGYKAYRHEVLDSFTMPQNICIIGGYTGSGKTAVLQALQRAGEQILDLEGEARHKGSAFGGLGMPQQEGTEMFENRLHAVLRHLDPSKRIWMEDESRNVGGVFIPQQLWDRMCAARFVRLEVPFDFRVKRLVKEYTAFSADLLCENILKIERRLGCDRCRAAIDAVRSGDMETAVAISLHYYDAAYGKQMADRKAAMKSRGELNDFPVLECSSPDPDTIARQLIDTSFK